MESIVHMVELHSVNGITRNARVSDLISTEEIKSWMTGENIIISAGTGKGKSYFIKNTLKDYCRDNNLKCLYLIPRTQLKWQFLDELPADDTITFKSYQAIEAARSEPDKEVGYWDVIVADEAHYFVSDATFNKRTDLSFNWIMEQECAVKIFMTATPNSILEYFTEEKISCRQYVFPFRDKQIGTLDFFYNEAHLEELAEQIVVAGNKAIFFIQKASKAVDLYQKHRCNAVFLCSKYNTKYAKYMDADSIETMRTTKKFDCSLLVATSALDVGFSLEDRAITDIIVDIDDPDTIIQCVGRKRNYDDSDRASVHIRARTNQQLGGMLTRLKQGKKLVKDFFEKGAIAYNATHERSNDSFGLIVDVPITENGKTFFVKQINKLRYAKIKYDISVCVKMLEPEIGFMRYVADLLNVYNYSILEDKQRDQSLSEYLESIAGKPMLTKKDKIPFVEYMNVRRDGKLCKSYEGIAGWIEGRRLPYRLLEYSTSRIVDTKKKKYKTAWKVVKLE